MDAFAHDSVMLAEVVAALSPVSGALYADATAGGGGHSRAILDASGPDGRVLAVDRDPTAVSAARASLAAYGARAQVVHGEFADLPALLQEHGSLRVQGLCADLGVSSPQLDQPERGFAFGSDGPLDMRMDPTRGQSLRELIDESDERSLADILFHYGEERRSRAIARSILRTRDEGELTGTASLRRAVLRASGPRGKQRIDPATRSFQGLRIAVNRELDQLEALLAALPDLLDDGAVAAIISFHSLEDRMVKHAFRGEPRLQPLHKKPQLPGEEEQARNPRSRSAKLRAARRRPRAEDETSGQDTPQRWEGRHAR
jgi:16S rRNA (cytosine1402-N4)-methyltransferase